MAQHITDIEEARALYSVALGSTAGMQEQGSLFIPTLLPRQLPIFKNGPEDEPVTTH